MAGENSSEIYSDKVIVITGASSGFGKGAALEFAKRGASVVLAARRDALLDDLATQCVDAGGQAIAVPTDVSHEEEVQKLAEQALSAFGRIDVWVNDAGVAAIGKFNDVPIRDHVQVLATNLNGTLYGSYAAMKQFRRQGHGTLISVASALGKIPTPYYASYVASKFGIVGLNGVLRQELAENNEENIHVCTVMPMAMDTYFFDHAANYTGHEAKPIPPVYDPQLVVDTIVRLVEKPENEIVVGPAGKAMVAMHDVFAALTEKVMGKETDIVQIEAAEPAPNKDGSVFEPEAEGTTVSAGRLNGAS